MLLITDRLIHIHEHTADLDPSHGAVVTFAGVVRSHNNGRAVTGMFYECYREMAEREMTQIVDEVRGKRELGVVRLVHRVGEVAPGEMSLLVVVTAEHRQAAFDACQEIVDEIKKRAPIWKKERYADSTESWL
jgi:molybdopterin synthase catalytic subunit